MPERLAQVLKLEVPVAVRLGERIMTLAEVLAWGPGSLIELPRRADSELELVVNNRHVGYGTAVKVGENFGIRLTFLGDVRGRLPEVIGGHDGGADGPTDDPLAAALSGSL
jgi:flagellar motor switch protein FliN/FliY